MLSVFITLTTLLGILVLLNLLLTIGTIRRLNQLTQPGHAPSSAEIGEEAGLAIGSPAPDFQAETLTGEIVTLANYARRAVSFIFVSPDCDACVEKLPSLKTLLPKARQAGVEMVLVNTGGDKAATATFIQQHHVTLPVLIAPFEENAFAHDYKVPGTPFFCLVNAENKVETVGMFGAEWEQLTHTWGHRTEVLTN
ncbi:MAG: TlpA disulfide reductase family protein [Caldilineaceae bacterium]